jgi:hypothetical protein
MRRIKRWVTNPFVHLYLIALVGAAGIGWKSTLETRREYYQRLADYYAVRATNTSPPVAFKYAALNCKYQNAANRPWTLVPPLKPEL